MDVLFGKVNPSGKLAETWPMVYEDCICSEYYGNPYKDAQYREGIYVGYRYYETAEVGVRFPFGYGLVRIVDVRRCFSLGKAALFAEIYEIIGKYFSEIEFFHRLLPKKSGRIITAL